MPTIAEKYGVDVTAQQEPEVTDQTVAEKYAISFPKREVPEPVAPPVEKGALEKVSDFALDTMAAVNKGAYGIANIPPTLFSAAVQVAGGQPTPTLEDIDLYQQGTYTGRGEGRLGHDYQTTIGEFVGGGLGFTTAAKQAAKALPKVQPKLESTFKGIIRDIAEVSYKKDAAISTGAAVGAQTATEVGLGPVGEFFGALFGGAVLAAPRETAKYVSSKNPFAKEAATSRVAKTVQSAAEDIPEAIKSVKESDVKKVLGTDKEVMTALETTKDMGLMTLQKSIMAEDAIARGDYHEFYKGATDALKEEMGKTLGKDENISLGLMQDFLLQNSKRINALVDDRIDLALNNAKEFAALNRGQINPASISVKLQSELRRAKVAVREQEDVLWSAVDKKVNVSTDPITTAAKDIVAQATKYDELPLKELRAILGQGIQKTPSGYAVGTGPRIVGTQPVEGMEELVALRSRLTTAARQATSGIKPDANKARLINQLQDAVMKAIEENPLASNYNAKAYQAATAFSRKYHDTFTRGLVGRSLAKDVAGGEMVLPEETLKALIGRGGERQAAGAREMAEVVAMASEAKAPTKALLQYPQEYIASRFQKEVSNHGDAVDFLTENWAALNRFPELRKTLQATTAKMGEEAGKAARLEAKRSSIEKLTFSQMTTMSGKQAIRHILNDASPLKAAKRLKHTLRSNPGARAGFKNEIADYLIDRSLVASQLPGVDTAFSKSFLHKEITQKEMKNVLQVWYTKDERRRLNKILEAVSAHNTAATAPASKIELTQTPIFEFITRLSVVRGGANLAGTADAGASLMLANTLSRLGKWMARNIPVANDRDILRRAMFDEELLTQLLRKDVVPYDSKLLAEISGALAYEHVKIAEQFEETVRASKLAVEKGQLSDGTE